MPAQPILSVDEFPITDGSTACIPLIAQIMADTTGLDLETARSAVTTNTTAQAWRNLGLYGNNYGDSVKLIIAYEAPESVKEELKADGDPLEQKAIGRDALVFIVNEDNPVQSLTLASSSRTSTPERSPTGKMWAARIRRSLPSSGGRTPAARPCSRSY
mgnify:CR=1 FL=1